MTNGISTSVYRLGWMHTRTQRDIVRRNRTETTNIRKEDQYVLQTGEATTRLIVAIENVMIHVICYIRVGPLQDSVF
jgi:hypothetical protein